MTSMLSVFCALKTYVQFCGLYCVCVNLCVCVWCRSDSDSEGENPEKKKLQEQLMGEFMCMGGK